MVILGLLFLLILGIMTFSSHSYLAGSSFDQVGSSFDAQEVSRSEPLRSSLPGSNDEELFKSPTLNLHHSLGPSSPSSSSPSSSSPSSSFRLTGKDAFLKREMLKNTSITCNDGTTAGYYLRKNPGSKKWIIFLEGGGLCFSPLSCQQRWKVTRFFMTSAHWPQIKSMSGILSLNQEENPFWYRANHVLVPYCSSDSWTGNRRSQNPGEFSFLGSKIIEQVILELLPQGLHESELMILAGESAGAVGVLTNLDRISDLMTLVGSRTQVRGLSDSGWFLDNKPLEFNRDGRTGKGANLCHTSPHNCPPVEGIKLGIRLWNGQVPNACSAQYPSEPWRCYFGYRMYQTLRTPIFIVQWIFDQAQMQVDNVANPVMKSQWNYIHNLGIEMKKSLENVTALFAPSCISHSIISKRTWTQIKINGVTLPEALRCWELESTERSSLRRRHQLLITSSLTSKGSASLRLNDNKLTGIIIRNNDSQNESNIDVNSINNVNDSQLITPGLISGSELITPGLISGSELITPGLISGSELITPGLITGSELITPGLISNQSSNQTGNELSTQDDAVPVFNSPPLHFSFPPSFKSSSSSETNGKQIHIKLIEEKDVTSSTTRRPSSPSSSLSPSLSSSSSPSSSVQRRRKRKRKHHRHRHNSNNNWNKRSKFPHGKYCRYHFMDTCSWPQCNRGCPKYFNPLTGKEMDFVQLFKSLGFNLTLVTHSFGLDESIIHGMDHESLHMLLSPD